MPFCYVEPDTGPLRQGEVIERLCEILPAGSIEDVIRQGEDSIDQGERLPVVRVDHPYSVVVSQDCDLEWDYRARRQKAPPHKLLSHVLLCGLFTRDEIRYRPGMNPGVFDRLCTNQDERYQWFESALIGDSGTESLPELVADFKAVFSLPVEVAYELTSSGLAVRRAIIAPPYLYHFTHRLFSYLGRIAVP